MRRADHRFLWYLIIAIVSLIGVAIQKPFLGRSHCVKSHKTTCSSGLNPVSSETTVAVARSILEKTCHHCQIAEFFAPRDDLKSVLLGLVMSEEKKLQLAAFRLTDVDFAKELIKAHERGIEIEIVADSSGLDTRTNQIIKLHGAGIPVYVYPNPSLELTSRFSIMHNKVLICHSSGLAHGMAVWTGSFNFTKSAAVHNRENAVVIIGDKVTLSYAAEFEKLKKESKRL